MPDIHLSRRHAVLFAALFLAGAVRAQSIDEIVVTADYRGRTAGDLPASVSVLDEDAIKQLAVQHFEELISAIPNLNWSGDGHRARYFQIRGVGELEQYQGAPNPSVGLLIDDIDFSGIGTIATLFDLQQVEVLRGPQGTRYGANALAGLIYMQSAAPTADWSGRAQVSAANDAAFSGGIAMGGPIDDELLFRASAHHHESDGFRNNPYLGRSDTNGRRETTLRGRFRWLPNDAWQVDLATLFADIDNGYDAFALDNGLTVLSDKPGKDAQESAGASLRIAYAGPNDVTVTAITAVADSDIIFSYDADWGNDESWAPVAYDYISVSERQRRTFSQELRVAGADWLIGAYAMRLEDDLVTANQGNYYDPFYDFADSLDDTFGSDYRATNIAVFGQFDRDVGDRSQLSFGIRGEHRNTEYTDSASLVARPSESMWGGDLTLSHDISGTVTSFASLSKGYKAGGFNLGLVPGDRREFGAEAMLNLEVGIKSGWRANTLQLNASLFVSRRDNQQVRTSFQLDPGDPASFVFFTDNAAEGDTVGLEADLRWSPNSGWSMYATLGWLDATFDQFETPQVNLNGREQAHAPTYTLATGARYQHASGFFARLDLSARDEFYFDVSHDQQSKAYSLANARIGYSREQWTAQLWVRNLFDEKYAVRGFYFGNEPPDFPNTLYTRQGDPRQAGVTFERTF